jgi:hypothetical protein
VYQEKDVPGRSPNIAEKAGVLEDYILAEIRPAATTATPGAAGTSGAAQFGTMYKLEHADDSKLKAVVGKRVEVTGQIDRESGDSTARPADTPNPSQADKAIGRDKVDLAEFEIVSIKEVPGACPASAKTPNRRLTLDNTANDRGSPCYRPAPPGDKFPVGGRKRDLLQKTARASRTSTGMK